MADKIRREKHKTAKSVPAGEGLGNSCQELLDCLRKVHPGAKVVAFPPPIKTHDSSPEVWPGSSEGRKGHKHIPPPKSPPTKTLPSKRGNHQKNPPAPPLPKKQINNKGGHQRAGLRSLGDCTTCAIAVDNSGFYLRPPVEKGHGHDCHDKRKKRDTEAVRDPNPRYDPRPPKSGCAESTRAFRSEKSPVRRQLSQQLKELQDELREIKMLAMATYLKADNKDRPKHPPLKKKARSVKAAPAKPPVPMKYMPKKVLKVPRDMQTPTKDPQFREIPIKKAAAAKPEKSVMLTFFSDVSHSADQSEWSSENEMCGSNKSFSSIKVIPYKYE